MSTSIVIGLVAVVCLVLLFKVMGFLLRLAAILVALGLGYWYLGPQFGWPALPI